MPIMNGFESTFKISQFINQFPDLSQPMIVALTGHLEQEYVDNAFDVKMDEVIEKPTNVDVIK